MSNNVNPASGCTGPSSCSLLPLPKKKVIHRVMPDDYRYGDVMGYTAKQMIEYARLCLAANASGEGREAYPQPPCSTGGQHGND